MRLVVSFSQATKVEESRFFRSSQYDETLLLHLFDLPINQIFLYVHVSAEPGSKLNTANICNWPEEVDIVINCYELFIYMRMTFLEGFAHNKKEKN